MPNSAMVEGDCHSLSQDKPPKNDMNWTRFGTWNVGSMTGRGCRCIGKEEGKGMLCSGDKMEGRRYKSTEN